jgi:hypothetical protein
MTDTTIDSEVRDYFVILGYDVDWDYNRAAGESWHELYKDGKLVAQIDKGVPLEDIIADLCAFHLGKDGVSMSDYKINGHGPEFDELLKKVYERTHLASITN